MAIKLKLRVPGSGSSSSSSAPASESQPALPKLKIKPPSIADNSTGKVSKKSKEKSKEKHKKLKISLSSKRPSTSSDIVTPSKPRVQPIVSSSGSVTTRSVPRVRIKPTRIPGDGYDSEAPDLEDDPLIEQGIVIRFLQDLNLDFVHNAVDSGDLTGINVKWVTREKAVVNVNGTLYSARLLDLPTVTEIFKTVDKKNVMKTFDVSQILLVLHKVVLSDLSMEKDFEVPEEYTYLHPLYKISKNSEIKPSKQVFRHGLTSPFEDVYRRFRVRKSTHRVAEDIENRVNELIRLDDDAEESLFELVDMKKAPPKYGAGTISGTPSSAPTPSSVPRAEYSEYSQEPEEQVQPDDAELLAAEDIEMHLEEELQKALDENGELQPEDLIEGESEVEQEVEAGEEEEEEEEEEDEDEDEDEEEDEDEDEDEEAKADKSHVKLLEEEISDLEKVVEYHRKNLATATSKMMRMKFQNTYASLKSSLDQKKRNLARLVEEQEQLQKKSDPTNIPHDTGIMAGDISEAEADEEEDEEEVNEEDANEEANDGDDDGNEDDNMDDIDDLF
ncbi:hypothetical protein G9P44_003841 [Scheffersomyces stipitis]|nr:hypothetical protein G9P44_003841 [Scheffersomyces stipitis]